MIKDGFTINECVKCVYTKITENACIIICLYVDDMLILGPILRLLSRQNMKDLRVADVILGITIIRTPDKISLSQSHCMNKMIERFKEYEKKEYKFFSPTRLPSQEYKNWNMTVRVFSNHRKSNIFNELHWTLYCLRRK